MRVIRMVGVMAALGMAIGCGGGGGGGGGDSAAPPVVIPPPVTLVSIDIIPNPASVEWGKTVAFTAMGTYSDATTKFVAATWSSLDHDVATIDGTGLATGVAGGTVTIQAVSSGKSASATLTVTGIPVVYGAHSTGLVYFPVTGGGYTSLSFTPAAGTTAPVWSNIAGLQPVDGGVYVLERVTGPASRLLYCDLSTNEVTLMATLPSYYWSLAADSVGRIHTIGNASGSSGVVVRYVPSTGAVETIGATGLGLGWEVGFDDAGDLYATGFWPGAGAPWIHRVSETGVATAVCMTDGSLPTVVSGGFVFGGDGALYTADALTGGLLYRGVDLNADGDYLDAGEFTGASAGFAMALGVARLGSSILVSDSGTIFALEDLNGDGDFTDAGEQTTWSTSGFSNGWTGDSLKAGTYAP